METKPPIPLAVLVGIQTPEIDDVAHEANFEELGRLVKTLGYEVIGTVSQKREGTGAGSLLGSGKLAELAALTGGTGVVTSMAQAPKSKAWQRFEGAAETASPAEPDLDAARKPEFVIVDHELSPSQIRNLERATGAQVLDRTGVIVEIFHRHANTREAKPQVEMARLKYVAPRLQESSAGGGRQQVNRSVKEATIKTFHYSNLESLKAHVMAFVSAYNFAKHLKALGWKTPFEAVCQAWTTTPDILKLNSRRLILGPNT